MDRYGVLAIGVNRPWGAYSTLRWAEKDAGDVANFASSGLGSGRHPDHAARRTTCGFGSAIATASTKRLLSR